MRNRTWVSLVAAFTAVVLAFVGSTIVAQRSARKVRDLSVRISRDAAPGIEAMARLRAEVERVELLVHNADQRASDGLESEIAAARQRLDAAQVHFQSLPLSDAERGILPRLQTSVRAFDEAVERSLDRVRTGKDPMAARELLPYANAAAAAAQQLLDVDAQEAEAMASQIERVHERADRIALELDALCVLLAALAAAMAVRGVRQMVRLQEEHRELVERKAAELEQFAGRVAHDILSPLSSVSLALSLTQKTAGAASQTAAARGMASLLRVRSVVDGLLEFARAGARPEPGATASVPDAMSGVQEELAPQAAAENVELGVDPFPDCAVSCSPGVLTVLLTNLVRNSIKYMGDAEIRRVRVSVRPRRATVLFEIEDSGPGVPEELGERIFDPYVRGKRAAAKTGIGLGLATVKRLVLAHGGSIGIRPSVQLGGVAFWFDLPRAEGEGEPRSVRSSENPAHPA